MPYWQKVVLQAAGPVISAIILGLIGAWIARRAQLRKEQWSLRHELIHEMTKAASALYNETLRFRRAVVLFKVDDNGEGRGEYQSDLERQYKKSRLAGQVIEDRLSAYFPTGDARKFWHRAMDLLSMRYFLLTEADLPKEFIRDYSGDDHTGLTVDSGLCDHPALLEKYRESRELAANAVLNDPFVGEWIGWRVGLRLLLTSSSGQSQEESERAVKRHPL
ncbi:hypothetical protein F7R91_12445 [Streptomyces luteolifulvus]|uniref:Uncharacterized protein n=1 Tax=Streptomyces luteolifulvus TaxID=2615112 RepID=A0A6H9V441_9ACTN|nr:hypothetical protein [Streptomyces luteolifulvus]KAB1147136.1 hypothetical protein F7R91_12445 [Streptomyces luteolifulvus]